MGDDELEHMGEREHVLSSLAWIAVVVIVVIASIPVMSGNTLFGHDLNFHVLRIQGIADGLAHGEFPVRMQYSQMNGAGYPVGIMYGDLLLYPSALLTLLGVPAIRSVVAVPVIANAVCAVTSYVGTSRAFGRRSIGVAASAMWTLSVYRLTVTYLRAALGECLALAMLPAVAYGLYSVLFHDDDGASGSGWLWLAMGVSGVVLSHVLSVLMVGMAAVPCLVCGLVARHDRGVWSGLAKSAASAIGICAFFAVPFVDYYLHGDMLITAGLANPIDDYAARTLISSHELAANNADSVGQLLMLFVPMMGYSYRTDVPMTREMPQQIGWGILLGLLLAFAIAAVPALRRRASRRAPITLFCVMSAAFAAMTTTLFPWGDESGIIGHVTGFLSIIQYPWRLIGIASFFGVLASCCALASFDEIADLIPQAPPTSSVLPILCLAEGGACFFGLMSSVTGQLSGIGPAAPGMLAAMLATSLIGGFAVVGARDRTIAYDSGMASLAAAIVLVALLDGGVAVSTYMATAEIVRDVADGNDGVESPGFILGVASGEYLPARAWRPDVRRHMGDDAVMSSDGVDMRYCERDGAVTRMDLSSATGGSVKLHVLWYKDYRLDDAATQSGCSIHESGDGYIVLDVPAGYDGNVTLTFAEPGFWRLGDAVTLMTVVILPVASIRRRRHAKAA